MIFDLVKDFADVLEAMPQEHPRRRILKLLDEAIRRDVHFIDRHPTTLFQSLWNTCWWYDCPEAERHYEEPEGGWRESPPWKREGLKLHHCLERWRADQERTAYVVPWLRSLRPPLNALGTALQAILEGHGGSVRAVAYAPEGNWLASASEDNTIRIWDAASGAELAVLAGDEFGVGAVAFSADGRMILSVAGNGTVRIWNTSDFSELSVENSCFPSELCKQTRVAGNVQDRSNDGQWVVSGSSDGAVSIRDTTSSRLVAVAGWHDDAVESVTISPDQRLIVSVSSDNSIYIWFTAAARRRRIVSRGLNYVHDVLKRTETWVYEKRRRGRYGDFADIEIKWDPKVRLMTSIATRFRKLMNRCVGALLASMQAESMGPIRFSPNSKLFAAGADVRVRVWSAKTAEEIACWSGHFRHVTDVAFSPRGTQVASASADATVRLWKLDTEAERWPEGEETGPASFVTLSPDGRWIGLVRNCMRLGLLSQEAVIYSSEDLMQRSVVCRLKGRITTLAFSADSRRIAIAEGYQPHGGYSIHLIDVSTNKALAVLRGHRADIRCLCFSPDGSRLESASDDKTVRRWNTETGKVLSVEREYPEWLDGLEDQIHDGPSKHEWVTRITYSPDGKERAVGLADGSVHIRPSDRVFRLVSGGANSGMVTGLAYSPDGTRVFALCGNRVFVCEKAQMQSRELNNLCETMDLVALAGGPESFPYVAVSNERETILKFAALRLEVAWLPQVLEQITTHPSGRLWCGISRGSNCFHIFTLEGSNL